MDPSAMTRAAISAGVFSGIAYLMSGGKAGLTDYLVSGGMQAAASLGSDTVHQFLMMYPTKVTASVVTGGLYTAAQHFLRGEDNYINNYGVSAVSEWSARTADDMLKKNLAGAEDAESEAEEY